MDEHKLRAERCLLAIAERGLRATAALEKGDWEAFETAMRWRKAAFHNFRALDFLIQKTDPHYLSDERWQILWKSIQKSDRAIDAQMNMQHSKLERQLGKIRQNRATLSRFHSGNKEQTGFVESV